MGDKDERDITDERGDAEAAAGRANNPGPPPSEHADPQAASARGINPVQHSERGINPVQHSERSGQSSGDEAAGDAERTGEGTGSRAGEYS